MANSNFVVQHGLTVGPLTIDAATGSISTPGNVNITGNLGVSSISKNDSSININDTGSSSIIVMNIDGTTEHTLTAARASFLSEVYAAGVTTIAGNLVANSATTSTSATTGAVVVVGGLGVSGNVNASGIVKLGSGTTSNVVVSATTTSTNTTTGALVVAGGAGIAGNVNASGIVKLGSGTTSNVVVSATTTSTNTTTGALVVAGGAGLAGNVNIGGQATVATQGTTPTAITNKDYVDTQNVVYGVVFGY